jgi:hypothetical protein
VLILRRIAFICFIFFICLCSTAWTPRGSAQNATPLPLGFAHTYLVTGDYVVGGVGLRGLGDGTGFATGTISIPDCVQAQAMTVPCPAPIPAGADIVAAFLYWETVESSQTSFQGQNGFFNGYPITGDVLGNPNAPTSWSSGGCSGSSQGTKTIRGYRADVRAFLPVDVNANIQPNTNFTVRLRDSGSNGGGAPLTLGASLVIVYRVLSPKMPLNAIVFYDGAFAPNNSMSVMTQPIIGFYDAKQGAIAKITHIVGDGQANKSQGVTLNASNLPFLYPAYPTVAFPGIYNGSWDNPTWNVGPSVIGDSSSVTTVVTPSGSGSGCVDWGTIVFSTTVQNTDNDGILNAWKTNKGYCDAAVNKGMSNQGVCRVGDPTDPSWVALPGATLGQKDLFVEIDYLNNLSPYTTPPSTTHTHLPKQAALDMAGDAFCARNPQTLKCTQMNVHFDVGNVYQSPMTGGPSTPCGNKLTCDPYIVSAPAGTGGNSISESDVLCNDGTTLCAFPGQPAVDWKGGFQYVRDTAANPQAQPPTPALGNFQPGRQLSYHYVLFGHSLGEEESYWSAFGATLNDPATPALVSIINAGTSATVTIQSPAAGVIKPGDCPNAAILACSDANHDRVTVSGAFRQPSLNGTYYFSGASSSMSNGVTTTTFTIPTSQVSNGTYNSDNEPQLGVSYLGPTSSSGHSDFRGGGDSTVTFGLWGADDPSNCQPNPTAKLSNGQVYCDDQVGSVLKQAGTLMHELGHSLTLTHGGTYYDDPQNQSVPTYEANCKPNYLSTMSYFFQVRGFPDNLGIDYSGQTFLPLDETKLDETNGIGNGTDVNNLSSAAAHYTRWYGPPNAVDLQVGRVALSHCDGSPKDPNEPPAVRVDGNFKSGPIDWNNDINIAPSTTTYQQDADFDGVVNGLNGAPKLRAFNDWQAIDLLQIGARAGTGGFSGSGGAKLNPVGGGAKLNPVGGGARLNTVGGGARQNPVGGGAKLNPVGGGTDQDEDAANSTADAPTALTCAASQNGVPGCVISSGAFLEKAKSVPLTWSPPSFGQIREYDVWRATGTFSTLASIVAAVKLNPTLFANISAPLVGKTKTTPPTASFIDPNVRSNTTYTYFITDKNKQGATSGASTPIVVTVKF